MIIKITGNKDANDFFNRMNYFLVFVRKQNIHLR